MSLLSAGLLLGAAPSSAAVDVRDSRAVKDMIHASDAKLNQYKQRTGGVAKPTPDESKTMQQELRKTIHELDAAGAAAKDLEYSTRSRELETAMRETRGDLERAQKRAESVLIDLTDAAAHEADAQRTQTEQDRYAKTARSLQSAFGAGKSLLSGGGFDQGRAAAVAGGGYIESGTVDLGKFSELTDAPAVDPSRLKRTMDLPPPSQRVQRKKL